MGDTKYPETEERLTLQDRNWEPEKLGSMLRKSVQNSDSRLGRRLLVTQPEDTDRACRALVLPPRY